MKNSSSTKTGHHTNLKYRRRILFINQYYPPDRSATAGVLERIVEYLSDIFFVTVLAGRPSYLPTERYCWKPLYQLNSAYCKIVRVGSLAYSPKNKLYRSLNYISYLSLAAVIASFTRTELIISMTDPPLSGIIGAFFSKIKNIPFIYYVQDLHPEMAIASGMIRPGIITRIWDSIHKFILKSANRIIVIGDDMRDKIVSKGIPCNKIVVIRHGAAKFRKKNRIDVQLINRVRNQYSFIFMHAGNLGYYGAWENIVQAINKFHNNSVGFIFVGEGQNKAKLIEMSKSCSNIEFIPYQPREKVKSILESGDVHIITIKKGLEGLVVPSKLYPILSAHKPILAICPGACDTARIVKRFKCGIVADPDSPDEIAEAINYFYLNRKNLDSYCRNSKDAGEFHNREGQLKILKQELKRQFL